MKGVIPIPEDEDSEDENENDNEVNTDAAGEEGQKAEYDYIWASEDESGEEWDPKEWGR